MPNDQFISSNIGETLQDVLQVAKSCNYKGYSKHDALNAKWLEKLTGFSRYSRLVAIQAVMRFPANIRPLCGVEKKCNAKGMSLFSRALLAHYRILGVQESANEARVILDWLVDNPSPEFSWPCWGYPYPWQDVGFFAPRYFPNRVVTSFVVQALMDGYETLGDDRYLKVAQRAVNFLLEAPRTLYEDNNSRCVSYVPSEKIDWIVMDVSILSGAVAARVASATGDNSMMTEAGRLVRYVVGKQTEYSAWFYSDPPSSSHITHDNYHTGFILDAILSYTQYSKNDEFMNAYHSGLAFYKKHLFELNGAPRFMSDQKYPFDIHGAAQGIITFSLATRIVGNAGFAEKILGWTLEHMYDPRSHWFYYQKRRLYRTKIPLLRWCQAWMSWAMACYLEQCKE